MFTQMIQEITLGPLSLLYLVCQAESNWKLFGQWPDIQSDEK